MRTEGKKPDLDLPVDTTRQTEAILDVFRDLGLEDARERDKFQKLAELGDWHIIGKRDSEPQDTQNNTKGKQGNTYA